MAGWTKDETALWIRGQVQGAQWAIEDFLREAGALAPDGTIPKDGRYSKALHEAIRAAMAAKADPASGVDWSDWIAALDASGPGALSRVFAGEIDDLGKDALLVAWAWWNVRTRTPKARDAYTVLRNYNQRLMGYADQPLTPEAASIFVGDLPLSVRARSKLAYVLGGLVLAAAAGYVGWIASQRRFGPRPALAPAGRR